MTRGTAPGRRGRVPLRGQRVGFAEGDTRVGVPGEAREVGLGCSRRPYRLARRDPEPCRELEHGPLDRCVGVGHPSRVESAVPHLGHSSDIADAVFEQGMAAPERVRHSPRLLLLATQDLECLRRAAAVESGRAEADRRRPVGLALELATVAVHGSRCGQAQAGLDQCVDECAADRETAHHRERRQHAEFGVGGAQVLEGVIAQGVFGLVSQYECELVTRSELRKQPGEHIDRAVGKRERVVLGAAEHPHLERDTGRIRRSRHKGVENPLEPCVQGLVAEREPTSPQLLGFGSSFLDELHVIVGGIAGCGEDRNQEGQEEHRSRMGGAGREESER